MDKLKTVLVCVLGLLSTMLKAQPTGMMVNVPFTLATSGYVSLVIENQEGMRVRNLCSDTYFKAGNNSVSWDGLDDLGRDAAAAAQGTYHVVGHPVPPGTYTVRGIVHPKINYNYAFSVYAPGSPPWTTNDHRGGWLANHTAPQAAVFVPAERSPTKAPVVFLGCYVTEGPDGLAWVDLNGKKMGGRTWIGGNWTGAPFMAADKGGQAMQGVSVYTAATWKASDKSSQVVLRISALPDHADQPVFVFPFKSIPVVTAENLMAEIGGFAVNNGVGVASLPRENKLVLMDLKKGTLLGLDSVSQPMGLAFDSGGRLLVLSGNRLLRYRSVKDPSALPEPEILATEGLDGPVGLTTDDAGQIYVSNGGSSQQVLVFNDRGKMLRRIGQPGIPSAGKYNPLHMNHPAGLTVDSERQIWVAENDYLPKRVSVWSEEGKLIRAFYGPAKYGGGGTLDPQDKNKFYYAHAALGTLEFHIDWTTGKSVLEKVLYRQMPGTPDLALNSASPETPLYFHGRRYFTNCYNSNPTGGSNVAYLFTEKNGALQPAAAMGRADSWPVFKENRFRALLPAGVNLSSGRQDAYAFFIWNDLNENGLPEPAEVNFEKGESGGVTVMPDLSFCVARLNEAAVQFSPVSFTSGGVPVYQITSPKLLTGGVLPAASSGGNQALATADGYSVLTLGVKPFNGLSISGGKDGTLRWSYPDLWPGLHAAHTAPLPSFKGELIGTTRLLGGMLTIGKNNFFAVNSNHGMVYLFTADGLFVTTLFEPMRAGKPWNMTLATPGMNLEGISLGEENFWPGITATAHGEVYLVDGGRSSLVKVEGLQNVKRLNPITVRVGNSTAAGDAGALVKEGSAVSAAIVQQELKVPLLPSALKVDGLLDDWIATSWVDVDERFAISASVQIGAGKLYAAWRTGEPGLLQNSGELPLAAFKTGGILDLMISNTAAVPAHKVARAGDIRLTVTLINGHPQALLYQAVVEGTKEADKIPFSSPSRTITFDRVDDITKEIEFAANGKGNYEISVPLGVLQLKPVAGMQVKGDIGVIRGDGAHPLSRMYWHNKATAIISDVPSEAELVPGQWGTFVFSVM